MHAAPPPPEAPLYTRAFLLLCISQGLFAASFNMMSPELPAYLTALGGAEHKGLIIALFTITAGISRPFSGKLADTIGRIPVMYIGVLACMVCGVLYPPLAFINGFLALRFFHGFSTGFKPTGTAAYVADIVPEHRRGEAMGILGICFSLGISASPPIGSWMAKAWSLDAVFYSSAVLAALSMAVMAGLKETLPDRQPFRWRLLRVTKDDIYDPLAIPAAIFMILCYGSYGIILTLAPDLTDEVGVGNRGTVFMLFTAASILTRLFAGKISDRMGREPVLKVSALTIAAAMIAFANTHNPAMLYLSSIIFGLGNGMFSPAINAWTVDLGDPHRRGRSMATMYIALEIAIGVASALAGWYVADQMGRMPAVFYAAAGLSMAGFLYLWKRGWVDEKLGV
ncbi:MAG: MFS transporter, partial [Saprospiraceae bacterium]